jgi:hypothetical protein
MQQEDGCEAATLMLKQIETRSNNQNSILLECPCKLRYKVLPGLTLAKLSFRIFAPIANVIVRACGSIDNMFVNSSN